MDDAQVTDLIGQMTRRGLTVATAESLTGGGLVARMVDVPGASHVVRGGACTYAVDTKASVLGVSIKPDRWTSRWPGRWLRALACCSVLPSACRRRA